jgi:hypothetical protein
MGSFGLSLLLSSLLTHGAVSSLYPTVETNYKRKYDHIFPPYSCRRVIAHYRSRLLCRGSQALGKASKALGKAFAERSSRQSALGENSIGKGFFTESRISGTRQRLYRVPDARQSAK